MLVRLRDEEASLVLCGWELVTLGKAHLLVVGWREDLFLLGLVREFLGEDLTLNVGVRSNVSDVQGCGVTHHVSPVQVFRLAFRV